MNMVSYLCYYTSPRESQGWVLIAKKHHMNVPGLWWVLTAKIHHMNIPGLWLANLPKDCSGDHLIYASFVE